MPAATARCDPAGAGPGTKQDGNEVHQWLKYRDAAANLSTMFRKYRWTGLLVDGLDDPSDRPDTGVASLKVSGRPGGRCRALTGAILCRLVNALLRHFVELIGPDLAAAGFVRRGPVFRYFDPVGNGIALDIQRTTALYGKVEFFINVGVLLAPHLRHYFGPDDPSRDAMPHHSVWRHRLVATDDTAEMSDHTFSLSSPADGDRAAAIVLGWLRENLPRLKSWLGDFDAMFAAIDEDRERSARAREEQLTSGWKPGRWPDGRWSEGIIRVFAYAERGDVDAVRAETASWDDSGPDSLAAGALALADQRRTERKG